MDNLDNPNDGTANLDVPLSQPTSSQPSLDIHTAPDGEPTISFSDSDPNLSVAGEERLSTSAGEDHLTSSSPSLLRATPVATNAPTGSVLTVQAAVNPNSGGPLKLGVKKSNNSGRRGLTVQVIDAGTATATQARSAESSNKLDLQSNKVGKVTLLFPFKLKIINFVLLKTLHF